MPAWSSREVAAAGAVMASMVALGYALSGVPNVELVTLTAFIGGWWLGAGRGAPVAASGEFLFSILNPQGPALPPVLVTQVAGMTLAAMAGGWVRGGLRRRMRTAGSAAVVLGITGALLTLCYDILTNAGTAVAMGMTHRMLQVILAGVAFSFLHIVTNTAVFAILGPAAVFMVEKRRAG